jgi:lipopolysaccharide/colanic/teichoic acid biosynthesis glycosyltransferase
MNQPIGQLRRQCRDCGTAWFVTITGGDELRLGGPPASTHARARGGWRRRLAMPRSPTTPETGRAETPAADRTRDTRTCRACGSTNVDEADRLLPLAHEPFFYVEPVSLARWQLVVKRLLDLVVAGVALVAAAPVIGVAALLIKLEDGGPVFFRQVRVGRGGELFALYKLRTMKVGAESELAGLRDRNVRDGPLLKIPDDPRVRRLGRLLRAASIDELPQLWNVLNGTMSLVGPRPALPDEVAQFDDELRAREAVRPGITGLWQVEARDNPSFLAYRRFDLFYIQNWSVALDLKILASTAGALVNHVLRMTRHATEDTEIDLVGADRQRVGGGRTDGDRSGSSTA